jgi:putative spermidine/putrescine transport system ATP-binding protein
VPVENGIVRYGETALSLAEAPADTAAQQLLLLRPEKLLFLNGQATGHATAMNRLQGTVTETVFQGESVLLTVRLQGGHEIHTRLPNRQLDSAAVPEIGAPIELGLAAEDTLLVPGDR